MPHVRSVTVGVWLTRGSRHESDAESGIAHFVEHMLFKGTTTRSAREIAQAIDSIGGQLDAFTAKEYAGYYIKVLDEHLPLAVDLLGDMVMRPALAPADVEREQDGHPRRNQDGRGRARRSGARDLRAAVLGAPSAGPADSRDAGHRGVVPVCGAPRLLRAHVRRAESDRGRGRPSRTRAACATWSSVRSPISPSARPGDRSSPPVVTPGVVYAPEGHRTEPRLPRHAGLPPDASRSVRHLRAEHDSRRLDELAPVPAHPGGPRPGLRGLQQSVGLSATPA